MRKENWGVIDYELAVARQLEMVGKVADKKLAETLIFCSHQPVVTTGRTTPPRDVFGWRGPIVASSRGGRATYHGPNQLVVYPIVDLSGEHAGLSARNVRGYVSLLGQTVVKTLAQLGLRAQVLSGVDQDDSGERRQLTGVWTNRHEELAKIASIGVAVKRWVTYHGVAINLLEDREAFTGINPCGFRRDQITSVEEVLGKPVGHAVVADAFAAIFAEAVERSNERSERIETLERPQPELA